MQTLAKIDLANIILDGSKLHPDILDRKFIESLFIYLIKEQQSLFFFKSSDVVYALKLIASERFIRNMSEFWYQIEDFIFRS